MDFQVVVREHVLAWYLGHRIRAVAKVDVDADRRALELAALEQAHDDDLLLDRARPALQDPDLIGQAQIALDGDAVAVVGLVTHRREVTRLALSGWALAARDQGDSG